MLQPKKGMYTGPGTYIVHRRLTVISARRLLADDTGGEATSGTAAGVNDADCRSVHIAPWPRCVFAAVCKGDFDHLLDGSEATRQWLSDIHDVWPDGLSEQEWISSTVKVVDPSTGIDQRVVIRRGRPTLQPSHLNSGGSGGQPDG